MKDEKVYEKIKPLLIKLHSQNVVPFIGAGVSFYFGYPLWNDLLVELFKKLGHKEIFTKEDLKGRNPLQIAEGLWLEYRDSRKKETNTARLKQIRNPVDDYKDNEYIDNRDNENFQMEFNKIVCECIYEFNSNNKKTYAQDVKIINQLSGEFNFHNIITTNYDTVLENEIFKNIDYKILYPRSQKELNHNDCDKTIYKIHGNINNMESIILTNSQYYDFMYNMNYYKSRLYTIFASNTILMLGYGFGDINIQNVYFQFRNDYKKELKQLGNNPKVFLVIRKSDKYLNEEKETIDQCYCIQKKFLEGCGFVVIDEYESLTEFISDLVQEWKKYTQSLTVGESFPHEILKLLYSGIRTIFKDTNNDLEITDIDVAMSYIRLINLNFMNPTILTSKEFGIIQEYNLEDDKIIPIRSGKSLLEFVNVVILKNNPGVVKDKEYRQLVLNALKFTVKYIGVRDDYYLFPLSFEPFISLCIRLDNFEFNENEIFDFARLFGKAIDFCPCEYHDPGCREAGRLLRNSLFSIPIRLLKLYIGTKVNEKKKFDKDRTKYLELDKNIYPQIYYMGNNEKKWLEKLKSGYTELKNLIEEMFSLFD